ncbi:MAG: alkaline phosphatase [Anaerolineae bacterium]|nr:MAG: alkaline phosphatase [Anaerolineae bacterium]
MVRFAVIGDYGDGGAGEASVAALVDSWNVDFVVTAGDNNYKVGSAETIDEHIGQFYHGYIAPYNGAYGQGADINRFFPVPGNHDWGLGSLAPYLDYFTLPGNERYYTFTWGAVTFFMLDSDWSEPDGNTADSVQAAWLQSALAASDSPWNIVVLHHPPYSSGRHGDNTFAQWPFAEWGADVVIGGHDHTYERIVRDGIVYFVNGIGGAWRYDFGDPVEGSQFRYNADYGAMLVEADASSMRVQFITAGGEVVDTWIMVPTH